MAYELISRVVLTAGATKIEVTNIPQTYKHLWVQTQLIFDGTVASEVLTRINGYTGTDYRVGWTQSVNGSVGGSNSQGNYWIMYPDVTRVLDGNYRYRQFILLPSYTNSQYKRILWENMTDNNYRSGVGSVGVTSAVTSISFEKDPGRTGNWATGSELVVWGIS